MKKKILIAICTLFAVCTMFIGMNKVSATIPAQAPQNVPQENTTKFYAILDEAFQYGNYVNFDGIMANKDMRKIILTADSTIDPTKLMEDANRGKWFTVYCLDGSLKFPSFSFNNAYLSISSNSAYPTKSVSGLKSDVFPKIYLAVFLIFL